MRADDLGVDDDQRPGADHPRLLHERRDRPAGREATCSETAGWEAAQRKLDALLRRARRAARLRGRAAGRQRRPRARPARRLRATWSSTREAYERIKAETLRTVRGTVQADILKEDQAQNTCIFSTEFALKMMGDVQEYFVDHEVRNFYSVSISGYHIAEAGANPISQLAFTLANGFTIVEYYLARGMDDRRLRAEPVLLLLQRDGPRVRGDRPGRAADLGAGDARALRRLARAARCSSTTSRPRGRSLHAQEISFNDIRTTLQALYAIFDNCNSLHTNAYDEAITTPTEESVRRAVAIQLIINRELGLNFSENPWQGSFIIDELTDLVEEAVYEEFERISERGGVLGAMDTMYQRGKIQEESLLLRAAEARRRAAADRRQHVPAQGRRTASRSTQLELMRSTDAEKERPDRQRARLPGARRRPARRPRWRSCRTSRARAGTCSRR